MEKPNLYIIAGCNGAGKTTASLTILPEILHCSEFVNADAIAAGLSPFHPENVAIEAGKLMLKRIDFLIESQKDFAIETTLSSKNHLQTIKKAQEQGFEITLLFFWLNSVELAKERVKIRVSKGGHNIPQEIIARRYERGLENLERYCALCNDWFVYDNSNNLSELIMDGNFQNKTIYNEETFKKMKQYENKA
ncbi:MAG: zeta toxin family protein [Arcicella sp.]|nr:zeta toxin family protein [Arcicella sp.]